MALIRDGGIAGQISGAIGPNVFARNRYGAYVRARTIPTTSTTPYALDAKAILSAMSQGWQNLTAAQRLAWSDYAAQTPWFNRIGQAISLTGQAMYVSLNSKLSHAGQTLLTVPAIGVAPPALTTLTATWDIGAGDFEINFTPTPLGATQYLWIEGCVMDSTAVKFVKNRLRFIGLSAAAQATGYDTQAQLEARFGALVVAQTVTLYVSVFSSATGLSSQPQRVDGVVVST